MSSTNRWIGAGREGGTEESDARGRTLPAQRPGRSGRPAGAGAPPREVRVSLLGTFALTADGARRELPKSGQRLVALLALNPRGLPRSDAARRLTPLLETESARASLRKALTRLRATRLPLVETDRATLRLSPRVTVDVREAEALAARLADRSQPLPEDARHEILTLEPLPGCGRPARNGILPGDGLIRWRVWNTFAWPGAGGAATPLAGTWPSHARRTHP